MIPDVTTGKQAAIVASRSAVCQAGLEHDRHSLCRAPAQPGTRQTCRPRGETGRIPRRILATAVVHGGTWQTSWPQQRAHKIHGIGAARHTSESPCCSTFWVPTRTLAPKYQGFAVCIITVVIYHMLFSPLFVNNMSRENSRIMIYFFLLNCMHYLLTP
jgi:hypothetical protein